MAGLIHIQGEDGKELSQEQARAFLQQNGMGHLSGLVGDDDVQVCCKSSNTKVPFIQEEDDIVTPKHYAGKNTEVIDMIEDAGCLEGFVHGNAIKYICRMGRKGPVVDDVQKAIWYTLFYFFKVCKGSKDDALAILDKTYNKANQ